jgi:cell division protein FtsQ
MQNRLARKLAAWMGLIAPRRIPRGAGIAATLLLLLATAVYGVLRGDHIAAMMTTLKQGPDAAARILGFGIQSVSIVGRRNLSEQEILISAGVSESNSLLFFDVDEARGRLKGNPWVAEAAVRKFYPDRLQIEIEERDAFAIWQRGGKLSIVAADGAVLSPYSRRFAALPLVVGTGAEVKAKEFLATLGKFPSLRDQVRAAILIAERRWNLRLKNGIDVRLPELELEKSLERLVELDRDKRLLSRDITAVDLRLPDRVGVRLSEAAAQGREEALKPKKPKRKGSDA